MKIKRVYWNAESKRLAREDITKKVALRTGLAAALIASFAGSVYIHNNSLQSYSPQDNPVPTYSEKAEPAGFFDREETMPQLPAMPQMPAQSLEDRLADPDSSATTPLPSSNSAKLYSSNTVKKYAEQNVEALKKKGIAAYFEEAMFQGRKVYRTLIELADGLPKRLPNAASNYDDLDYDSLHMMEQIIFDKVTEYNAKNPDNPVDFHLARSIAFRESSYEAGAVAKKTIKYKDDGKNKTKQIKLGRGLFQMMPKTAKDLSGRSYSERDLLHPEISAELGIAYIGYLQKSPHVLKGKTPKRRLELLLAGYNGGEPALFPSKDKPWMLRYEDPRNAGYAQTRDYVPKVMRQYTAFSGSDDYAAISGL